MSKSRRTSKTPSRNTAPAPVVPLRSGGQSNKKNRNAKQLTEEDYMSITQRTDESTTEHQEKEEQLQNQLAALHMGAEANLEEEGETLEEVTRQVYPMQGTSSRMEQELDEEQISTGQQQPVTAALGDVAKLRQPETRQPQAIAVGGGESERQRTPAASNSCIKSLPETRVLKTATAASGGATAGLETATAKSGRATAASERTAAIKRTFAAVERARDAIERSKAAFERSEAATEKATSARELKIAKNEDAIAANEIAIAEGELISVVQFTQLLQCTRLSQGGREQLQVWMQEEQKVRKCLQYAKEKLLEKKEYQSKPESYSRDQESKRSKQKSKYSKREGSSRDGESKS